MLLEYQKYWLETGCTWPTRDRSVRQLQKLML